MKNLFECTSILFEIIKHRKMYIKLIKSHYFLLYSGSDLGIYWLALGPLILLGLYSITYSLVYKIVLPDYSVLQYIINVYAGIILLLSFMNLLSSSTNALKINYKYRPFGLNIISIPTKVALTESIPFLVGLILLAFLSIIATQSFLHVIVYPFIFILYLLFSIGIARLFTIISVLFKDIAFIIPYIGIILLLVTPISYIPKMIPDSLKILFIFNPIYYFCIFLQSLSVEAKFNFSYFLPILLITFITPILGKKFFNRFLPLIRDSLSE